MKLRSRQSGFSPLYLLVLFSILFPSFSFSNSNACPYESIQKIFNQQADLLYDEFITTENSIDNKLYNIQFTFDRGCSKPSQSKCVSQDIELILETGRKRLQDLLFISNKDIKEIFDAMAYDVSVKCDVLFDKGQLEDQPCSSALDSHCG